MDILKVGLPQDRKGKLLLAFPAIIAVTIYYSRARFYDSSPIALGLGLATCWPLFGLLGLGLIALLVWTIKYTFGQNGHPLPLLLLLVSVPFGFYLPVPPTPEEVSFSSYRAEYEEMMELAHNYQLIHSDTCNAQNVFAPPAGYKSLAESNECIFVEPRPALGLIVEFRPRDFYHLIVYFQDPTVIEKTYGPCHRDGKIYKKLDEHWYICIREWN